MKRICEWCGARADDKHWAEHYFQDLAVDYAQGHKEPHCDDPVTTECSICGEKDCPMGDPFHYHHDGCPAETMGALSWPGGTDWKEHIS
jgi:hypothetical protein